MTDVNRSIPVLDATGAAQTPDSYRAAPSYCPPPVDAAIYYAVSPFNENATDYRFFCAKSSKARAIWGAIYPFLIFIGAEFASVMGLMVLFLAMGRYNLDNLAQSVMSDLMLVECLAQILPVIILVSIYVYQKKHSIPQRVPVPTQQKWTTYIAGGFGVVCIAFGLDLLTTLVSMLIPMDSSASEMISEAISNSSVLVAVVGTAILPPILEEVLFRGMILERLSHVLPARTAIAVSAIVFGVSHANLEQGIFAAIFGLALGYLYMKTHSVIPGIIAHFINNLVATVLYISNASDFVQMGVIAAIGIASAFFFVKLLRSREAEVMRNAHLVKVANILYNSRYNMIYNPISPLQVPYRIPASQGAYAGGCPESHAPSGGAQMPESEPPSGYTRRTASGD